MAGGGDSIRVGVTCVWDAALHRQFEDKTLSPPPVLARDHFAAARGLGDRPMCPGIVAAQRYACEIRDSVKDRLRGTGGGCWPSAFGLLAPGLSGNCVYELACAKTLGNVTDIRWRDRHGARLPRHRVPDINSQIRFMSSVLLCLCGVSNVMALCGRCRVPCHETFFRTSRQGLPCGLMLHHDRGSTPDLQIFEAMRSFNT
jgi:hypothetical protein